MLDSTFLDRFSRLTAVRLSERRRDFPLEVSRIGADMSARGALHSSTHVLLTKQAHERELDLRSVIVWEAIVRVHRTLGAANPPELRADLKALLHQLIAENHKELSGSLASTAQRFGGQRATGDMTDSLPVVLAKHQLEVDLYIDSLPSGQSRQHAETSTYNFYGNVGSVQTGAHASAHVVQNLAPDEKAALAAALKDISEALSSAASLHERQRSELIDLAKEAEAQLGAANPNNTKLLTAFNVLATTVQTLPNAQPAYQALKTALLPLGVMLP